MVPTSPLFPHHSRTRWAPTPLLKQPTPISIPLLIYSLLSRLFLHFLSLSPTIHSNLVLFPRLFPTSLLLLSLFFFQLFTPVSLLTFDPNFKTLKVVITDIPVCQLSDVTLLHSPRTTDSQGILRFNRYFNASYVPPIMQCRILRVLYIRTKRLWKFSLQNRRDVTNESSIIITIRGSTMIFNNEANHGIRSWGRDWALFSSFLFFVFHIMVIHNFSIFLWWHLV